MKTLLVGFYGANIGLYRDLILYGYSVDLANYFPKLKGSQIRLNYETVHQGGKQTTFINYLVTGR